MKSALLLTAAYAALVVGLVGCDGDGHHGTAESCQRIIDACHDVDPGTGEIHSCHETAHDDGTATACDPIADRCVMLCEDLANTDAGPSGDAGSSSDGGA